MLGWLGIIIDDKLNFTEHVKSIAVKAGRLVGVKMRLGNLILEKVKLQLYRTVILPHLTYCSVVWHFIKASDTRKLERIQERALRAIYRDKVSSYEELLATAGLPTLFNRRLQDIAILMFKVKNNLCPQYIVDLFERQQSNHNLRNADFILPRFDAVTYGKHSVMYLGPKLWAGDTQSC